MSKDLRSFLADVVRQDADALRRVDDPVDPRFGITAWGAASARQGDHPAFWFTDVIGADLPCVTNLAATRRRLALALGCDVASLPDVLADQEARTAHPPREVARDDAPVKEVVHLGDDADLTRLPIPVHNELDGGPFLTAGVAITRDPDSGALNAGIYRHQVHGPRSLGVWFFGSHHGGVVHRRHAERGEETPIAIAIGHHPAFLLGAVARVPGIGGEYQAAGAYLDEPVDVVPAETNDLLVPAAAEIVIEGAVLPDEQAEEGPFAEWAGHYIGGGTKPVVRVDAITHRRDAIFHDIQASGREHLLMGALPRISSVTRSVRQVVGELVAVDIPLHARMHCYVSLRKTSDTEPLRAGFAALNTEPENLRMVVVVDDDIDVHDEAQIAWAIGTRFDAARDLQVIDGFSGPGGLLATNWAYDEDGGRTPRRSSAIVVDATKPAPPVVYPTRARVPDAAVAAVDLDRARPVAADELPGSAP